MWYLSSKYKYLIFHFIIPLHTTDTSDCYIHSAISTFMPKICTKGDGVSGK